MIAQAQGIPELDRSGLRKFGILFGSMFALIFGLFLPWFLEQAWPIWPWTLFAVFTAWSLLAPMSLRTIYRIWMCFGILMSKITTPILMALVFYLMITPVGAIRRLFRKDSLNREFTDAETYRVASKKAPVDKLKRPF